MNWLTLFVFWTSVAASTCAGQNGTDFGPNVVFLGNAFSSELFKLLFCGKPILEYNTTFHGVDRDSDGSVSAAELESNCVQPFAKTVFDKFDDDGNGTLGRREFSRFLREHDAARFYGMSPSLDFPTSVSLNSAQRYLESSGYSVDPETMQTKANRGQISISRLTELYRSGINGSMGCKTDFNCSNLPKTGIQVFDEADANLDDTLSFGEFNKSQLINSVRSDLKAFFDRNKDSFIDETEWYRSLYPYISIQLAYGYKNDIFDQFDADKDGQWSKEELMSYMRTRGYERKNAWKLVGPAKHLSETEAIRLQDNMPSKQVRIFRNRINSSDYLNPDYINEDDDPKTVNMSEDDTVVHILSGKGK